MKQISQRMNRIQSSPTLALTAKAIEMKTQGKQVISFGTGEPDFDTPANIKAAAKQAMDDGQTKYTPVPGTAALKKAVCHKLKTENKLEYLPSQIIVTNGGKHALFQIMMALVDAGDEVIIPRPYWVSYPDQVQLFGGVPVFLETSDKNNFKITPEQLEKVISKKTIACVLNSPSNPTGAAYSAAELKVLADICVKNQIYIISDEIYEHMIYDDFEFVSVASLSPEIKDKTIVVNGVSKCYAMTGWRMGFAAGPESIIKAMDKAQGQATSNVCSITQAACVEAYLGPQDAVKEMVIAFKERRDYIVPALNAIKGISCNQPQGAFYVFPNVSALFGLKTPEGREIKNGQDLCLYWLEKYNVAVVPGSAFGLEGYVRLSYATSLTEIKEGVARIKQAVETLQ